MKYSDWDNIIYVCSNTSAALAVLICIVRICGVSVEYLIGALGIYAIATLLYFILYFFEYYKDIKEFIKIVIGAILVAVFCFAI